MLESRTEKRIHKNWKQNKDKKDANLSDWIPLLKTVVSLKSWFQVILEIFKYCSLENVWLRPHVSYFNPRNNKNSRIDSVFDIHAVHNHAIVSSSLANFLVWMVQKVREMFRYREP